MESFPSLYKESFGLSNNFKLDSFRFPRRKTIPNLLEFGTNLSITSMTTVLDQVSRANLLQALSEGWKTEQCGGEAREILTCMTWMGRSSSARLGRHLSNQLDPWMAEMQAT